jgi:hypothetical protein
VFPDGVPTMEQFRNDLAAARIEETDHLGRRVDFHALRHTLATNLSRGGVSPRVAMEMMRHSDMRLTMNTYTDTVALPVAEALEQLPRFKKRSQMRSQKRVAGGSAGAGVDSVCQGDDDAEVLQIQAFGQHQASADAGGQNAGESALCRTRTYDPLIKSQLLCQLS